MQELSELIAKIKKEFEAPDAAYSSKELAKKLGDTSNRVVAALRALKDEGAIVYTPNPEGAKKPGKWHAAGKEAPKAEDKAKSKCKCKCKHSNEPKTEENPMEKLRRAAIGKASAEDLLLSAKILDRLAASLRSIAALQG